MVHHDDLDGRVHELELWRRDVAGELRDFEEWQRLVKPFLEQLQADLLYRQRRHAETVGDWSLFAKVCALVGGVAVAVASVGGFILQILHATRAGH